MASPRIASSGYAGFVFFDGVRTSSVTGNVSVSSTTTSFTLSNVTFPTPTAKAGMSNFLGWYAPDGSLITSTTSMTFSDHGWVKTEQQTQTFGTDGYYALYLTSRWGNYEDVVVSAEYLHDAANAIRTMSWGNSEITPSSFSDFCGIAPIEISFTVPISSTTYSNTCNARSGMTWKQFVNSYYNYYSASGSLTISGSNILNASGYTVKYNGTAVTVDDFIIPDAAYTASSCCFVAGTKVMTSLDGATRAIEEVEAGDSVVSYNVETGENYLAQVTNLVVNRFAIAMAHVEFANGTSLDMTLYHPIYTKDGWHSLVDDQYGELVVGDMAKTADGWSEVTKIVKYNFAEFMTTYTLAIADFGEEPDDDTNDNFYANGVVVHNADPDTCGTGGYGG